MARSFSLRCALRQRRNISSLSECAAQRERARHPRTVRKAHRGGVRENRGQLSETEARVAGYRPTGRATVGSELAGGGSLRGPDRARCPGICEIPLEESRPLATVGRVERGLLSATAKCDGLESAGIVASLHSADRGRGRAPSRFLWK